MSYYFDKSVLVKAFGFPATLIHGDPLVLDRWLWIRQYLPGHPMHSEELIDIGCGSGSFTIGSALRGYSALGLSHDVINIKKCIKNASICKTYLAKFEVFNVGHLDKRNDLIEKFDIAINAENIEHIINDQKLINDIYKLLKPGGRLLLTTPNLYYKGISASDSGKVPLSICEDGGHVRRGYSRVMLEELCAQTGFIVEEITYCSGIISQKLCKLQRLFSNAHPLIGWCIILPFRILPPILDKVLTKILRQPFYCICMVAYKPRLFRVNTSGDSAY